MRASLVAGLVAAALGSCSAAAQTIALTNATLIDGSGAPAQPGITIVMEGGRIRDIGSSVHAPIGATVIDLTGKFVTPGIINGHGHVGPPVRDPQLRQYALYGVTTTTSMYFDQDDVQDFKRRQKAGDLRGARILTVMYRFMSEPFKPGSEAKTPEEGRAKVDEIVAKDTDFVKVWIDAQGGRYPKLTPEFTAAVMDQATKHNKIRMAHIVELEDARRMVDQGVTRRHHERVVALDVREIGVGPARQQELDARDLTGGAGEGRRGEQRRHAVGGLQIDGRTGIDERSHDLHASRERGDHEGRHAVLASPVRIRPFGDEP